MGLYLESGLREIFGVSDSLIKKARQEATQKMDENPCRTVVINGRTHVAYEFEMVKKVLDVLCEKNPRGRAAGGAGEPFDLCGMVTEEQLESALVRGVTEEFDGGLRSELTVLVVRRITKNRRIMDAQDPDGILVRLMVRNTERFIPGMEVPGCRQVEPELWVYEGREPRSRGRW